MSADHTDWRAGLVQFSDKTLEYQGISPETRVFDVERMVYMGVGEREHFSANTRIWNNDLKSYVRSANEVHVTSTPQEKRDLNGEAFTLAPSIKLHYFGCTSSAKPLRLSMDMNVKEARQLAEALMAAVAAVDGGS